jgi:hypothetical protein
MIAGAILVFGFPLLIIFSAFWIALKHRRSLSLPFLIVIGVLMGCVRLARYSPLGFFVSPGG